MLSHNKVPLYNEEKGLIHFISNVKKYYPVLSREEELETAELAKNGNEKARNKLICSNLLLVIKIANEYSGVFSNASDLFQEGCIGASIAADKYDPTLKYRFSTYAGWWIRASMLRYMFKNSHMLKLGSSNEQKKLFYNLRKEQNRLESMGISADADIVAHNLGVSEKDVIEMDCRLKEDVYLDNAIQGEDDDNQKTLVEYITSPDEQPDAVVEKNEFSITLHSKLDLFANKLKNDKYKYIFYNRISNDEPVTLQCIGNKLGLSRERVRQIELDIIMKLRKHLKGFA